MTEDELKAIEARVNAATPSPWDWNDERVFSRHLGYDGPTLMVVRRDSEGRGANLPFIVNAIDDVPALVAEVRRLREAIKTHSKSTHECEYCGHSEPCSTDDVCLVLARGEGS